MKPASNHAFCVTRIIISKKSPQMPESQRIRVELECHTGPRMTYGDYIVYVNPFYLKMGVPKMRFIDEMIKKYPAKQEDLAFVSTFDHQSDGKWKTIVLSKEAHEEIRAKFPPTCDQKKRKRLFTQKPKKILLKNKITR